MILIRAHAIVILNLLQLYKINSDVVVSSRYYDTKQTSKIEGRMPMPKSSIK